MRKPIVSGQFYSATREELDKEIKKAFEHHLGPGMPKVPLKQERIYGAIVPHAGYVFSGACATFVYKEFAELNKKIFPDTFIILGPNHSGYGGALSLSFDNFETPFGIVKNDTELGKEILQETSHLGLQENEEAHKHEHSIEVQLPFLQFISKIVKKEFKIVPIVISTLEYDKLVALASKIASICKNKNVCVIASSDFTHYGNNYGFMPFPVEEARTKIKELDRKAIDCILKLNSKNFYEQAVKTTICGTGAIVVALEICKKIGAKKAELLKYYTSAEISKDYSNAVGYASIVLK